MKRLSGGPRARRWFALPLGLAFAAAPAGVLPDSGAPAVQGSLDERRDPLGVVRTTTRPRVWILFDTSESMTIGMGSRSRFAVAQDVVRWVVRNLESVSGEPLVHWRLAAFRKFRSSEDGSSRRAICADPTMGAGLPRGSPGVPVTRVRCGGVRILSDPSGCDAEAGRTALLRKLPDRVNTNRTPNGIALYQLASHIARKATADLEPGQQNVIVLITDGLDTCECIYHPWLDFTAGPAGQGERGGVWLRTSPTSPDRAVHQAPSRYAYNAWNAGLKAKAAYLALNGGEPDAGLGDIHVVGVAMTDEARRGYTNHLAWMASHGRHPALYADRPETLRQALNQVLDEITLPSGTVKLGAPRLATVKELVASSPGPAFPGSDPTLPRDALVAPANDRAGLEETIRRRAAYADNILFSTSAELHSLRGRLQAFPTSAEGGGSLGDNAVWDAGSQLAERDPADRLILFNRAGSRELRPFEVGEVTAEDLGVAAGYLAEVDGAGARTAADAARIVVRLVRGEELAVHPGYRDDLPARRSASTSRGAGAPGNSARAWLPRPWSPILPAVRIASCGNGTATSVSSPGMRTGGRWSISRPAAGCSTRSPPTAGRRSSRTSRTTSSARLRVAGMPGSASSCGNSRAPASGGPPGSGVDSCSASRSPARRWCGMCSCRERRTGGRSLPSAAPSAGGS